MLFNSLHFGLFFILITIAFFVLPHKYRWALLLTASCYFYMVFKPIYILILAGTIVIDYYAGLLISKSSGKQKKIYLIASIIANVGVLAVFKYFNFVADNINTALSIFKIQEEIPLLKILLPIGLSFHTFQAMSYTIEVYRGKQEAEKHFGIYALYVMFYPQLVAGPIERPQNVLHQFHEKKYLNYENVSVGLKLMLWGFFKKLVIADRCSIYVDTIFNNPADHSAITLITASLFFTFQIYCDFSGYSDIAIGSAKVMGFDLMKNFNRPYFAKTIQEFWGRWHISLSTWFRDYLYISLGGNRVSKQRWYFNLLAVFLISGLWHGANWTFIVWGAIHGIYQIFGIFFKNTFLGKSNTKLLLAVNIGITFLLASFAWIFFRANNISDAMVIVKGIFTLKSGPLFIGNPSTFLYGFIFIAFLLLVEFKQEFLKEKYSFFYHQKLSIRVASILFITLLILLFGVFNGGQFIYFQF